MGSVVNLISELRPWRPFLSSGLPRPSFGCWCNHSSTGTGTTILSGHLYNWLRHLDLMGILPHNELSWNPTHQWSSQCPPTLRPSRLFGRWGRTTATMPSIIPLVSVPLLMPDPLLRPLRMRQNPSSSTDLLQYSQPQTINGNHQNHQTPTQNQHRQTSGVWWGWRPGQHHRQTECSFLGNYSTIDLEKTISTRYMYHNTYNLDEITYII